ncbi:MAG: DUF3604 domain-containing protein [bacterium]|nr:DUF3604 domain-containing protein [bacterium]
MKLHFWISVWLGVALLVGCGADPHWDDAIEGDRRSDAALAAQKDAQAKAHKQLLDRSDTAPAGTSAKRILFGDLHVHSSYSWDGFLFSLPLIGGEGAHPPNDACDFARHCANLDFYALTDHAESLLPEHWQTSKQSVRECNIRAGDPANPDLVAFMGFEWSQAGLTPEQHYGHRCVIYPGDADDELPARPISSGDKSPLLLSMRDMISGARWLGPHAWQAHTDYVDYLTRVSEQTICPEGIDTRELPETCHEIAPTPAELHEKLDQWGFPALSIPHGTAWGTYTPATTTIDKHLWAKNFDADYMKLIEVMSGHGNSEQFRTWNEFEIDSEGQHVCPEPSANYLPCCWQAGEIMRERCGDLAEDECERRVQQARDYAAQVYTRPHNIFPDSSPEDWLDCGQCRDCFKPSFSYRPKESIQYAMSLTQNDGGERRFRYGFIGSSDAHSGRPGASYKQLEPSMISDQRGSPGFPFNQLSLLAKSKMEDPRQPEPPRREAIGIRGSDMRVLSFLFPSGLAAVHAPDGSREAIWDALQRREVYGTSGPRILLWFDLQNSEHGPSPMGSEHRMRENPRFEVRAVGSFEQKPGCPETSRNALSSERLTRLCRDECYHPGDRRRRIEAIEVVRIRPQLDEGEDPAPLIEDPWRRFECPSGEDGCVFQFEDSEFTSSGRDALYYVRALEEPSMALSGAPLSTEFDAQGQAISVDLCTTEDVDAGGCPSSVRERAWSSPIFVDQAGS